MGTKERPIIFNTEMVRAILDGRKTQTRRVIKPQPPNGALDLTLCWPKSGELMPTHWRDRFGLMWGENSFGDEQMLQREFVASPYGAPGDRLWVRETFCVVNDGDFDGKKWVDYRASPKYAEPGVSHPAGWENAPDDPNALKWKPSIHMPRWASRLTLEVTGVRVERVDDITDADAVAEGMEDNGKGFPSIKFAQLWNSINAKRGFPFTSSPWVWVVEFKRIDD